MPFIPHTEADVEAMLQDIGAQKIDELYDEIPQNLRSQGIKNVPQGMNAMSMLAHAKTLARQNQNGTCFIGAGCYEHHIPAAVWDLASRGEFLTSYTPYQAEASQGTLQLLYEFQTMIAELTGMEVANASMYDGASALAEAILMAVRVNPRGAKGRVLIAGTVHPMYRETIDTIVRTQHIEVITLPYDPKQGITALQTLDAYPSESITAIVIQQPNFFGCLEAVDDLSDWAHQHQVTSIACVNPVAMALLKPPGQWGQHGVDIVCGEGQPFGAPMASGGPFFGFFSTRMRHVRQMPGRLIGRTVDKTGKTGFALTLQAREQHIRRKKATSNICTNQGLLVTAASIHLSLLGAEGLHRTALHCHHNTQKLAQALTTCPGVTQVFPMPFFHEVLLRFERPLTEIIPQLHAAGIVGGYPLNQHYPELGNTLLVCATEMRTAEEIAHYAETLKQILSGVHSH